MSLFQPTTTPIPIEQQIANAVLTKSNALFAHMIQFYNNNYQVVWNNPKATPDKIVASMGTNATKVFEISAALGNFINSIQPNTVVATMPAGWNFTANTDGSVVITKES
jgi:hypothetical protein